MCVAGFPGDDFSRCVPFCCRYGSEGQFSATKFWILLGDYFWKMFRILRNAWFDSGFMLMRQTTEALVRRSRRRHWQWHVQGWFAGYVAPLVVFP